MKIAVGLTNAQKKNNYLLIHLVHCLTRSLIHFEIESGFLKLQGKNSSIHYILQF